MICSEAEFGAQLRVDALAHGLRAGRTDQFDALCSCHQLYEIPALNVISSQHWHAQEAGTAR